LADADLRGLRVAVTGERRAEEQAALVRALGGVPFVCPTARVAWEDDTDAPRTWLDTLAGGVDDAVFMTGMGATRLLEHAERLGRLDEAVARLQRARVVVRGSKALPVLRRQGVQVDMAPQPPTSEGILAALGDALRGRSMLLQLAGPEPTPLSDGLRRRGADVTAVCIYRYPADRVDHDADRLVEAILAGDLDVVTFTSAPAVDGLVAASSRLGSWDAVRRRLDAMVVAAVGPVTADALAGNGVTVHVEPEEPRMGPMMRALSRHLDERGVERR
jgi:uroporphyrinogen-III synthase